MSRVILTHCRIVETVIYEEVYLTAIHRYNDFLAFSFVTRTTEHAPWEVTNIPAVLRENPLLFQNFQANLEEKGFTLVRDPRLIT